MVKFVLLFKTPPDENAFEEGYNANLAQLEKMPGIQRRQANMILPGPGGDSTYYRALEFYFENTEALDKAMLSPEGKEAGQSLISYAGDQVELFFMDVFEE